MCVCVCVCLYFFIFINIPQLEVALTSALPPLLPGESYECVLTWTAEEGSAEFILDLVSHNSSSTNISCYSNFPGAFNVQVLALRMFAVPA